MSEAKRRAGAPGGLFSLTTSGGARSAAAEAGAAGRSASTETRPESSVLVDVAGIASVIGLFVDGAGG